MCEIHKVLKACVDTPLSFTNPELYPSYSRHFEGNNRYGRGGGDRYGPPTRTDYRLIVENLSSRCSWQDLKVQKHISFSCLLFAKVNITVTIT